MKKFDNIFEQAREIIRQQWTLQDLHRQARSGPPADRRRPAPPHLRPPRLPAQRLTRNRMPWQGPHRIKRPRPTAQHSAGHITKYEKRFTR